MVSLGPPQRSVASDFEWFPSQILSITLFCSILIFEKEPVFLFQCSVLNKGTSVTIFITSLVWHGTWLWIESGTSHARCQHRITRLSRRRWWLGIEPGTSHARCQHRTTRLSRRRWWLGIEPGTSHTRCQHSTTRLSRRRLWQVVFY